MIIRLAATVSIFSLFVRLCSCSGDGSARTYAEADDSPAITARGMTLEAGGLRISSASAELDEQVWKLTGVGIRTLSETDTDFEFKAEEATFDMQSGHIEAAGNIEAVLGDIGVKAGRISIDSAAETFRMEGGLLVERQGIRLEGDFLRGRLCASSDFEVGKPRLELKLSQGE